MRHRAGSIVCILSIALLLLSGCLPAVVPTEHDYVLVLSQGEQALTILPDDDDLYDRFEAQVLDDPYLSRLLAVYNNTTEAFLATNKRSALQDTLANRPLIVLDTWRVGALRDFRATLGEQTYGLELGIALGPDTSTDLEQARQALARAVALSLMELAGLPHDAAFVEAEATLPLSHATSENWALRAGFAAALEARFAAQDPALLATLEALPEPNAEQQSRLARYRLAHAARYAGTEDSVQVPEAVAILMLRLMAETTPYYPQRHMLWMTNYAPEEHAEAKLLLALQRIPDKRQASVIDLMASYSETFPAESEMVERLMVQVLGEAALR